MADTDYIATVTKGESLADIADRYEIAVDQLVYSVAAIVTGMGVQTHSERRAEYETTEKRVCAGIRSRTRGRS